MNVIFIHDSNTSLQYSENKDIWRYLAAVLFLILVWFCLSVLIVWNMYSCRISSLLCLPSRRAVTLKWKNKQNKGSWVAHSWYNWLYHIKWNHTIRGRATKPVLPRQCRNEYPAALLSLLQILGNLPMPTKPCLPEACHVHPLCWNRQNWNQCKGWKTETSFKGLLVAIVWN